MRYLVFTLALLATSMAGAYERILSFDSQVKVQTDSSLEVIETIVVRAEGNQIRRGIFREFPTTYFKPNGTRTTVGFELLWIKRDGASEEYHVERRSNGVAVYVGHKDRFLSPGEYRYEIRYRTDRQLGSFADHDELYWNVTGVGWAFPIDAATARVRLPAGVPASAMHVEGYTGPLGARSRNYVARVEDGLAVFETTKPLPPQQGLTIVVTWPKGFVAAPGALAYARYFLRDNRPLGYALMALLCVLGYYFLVWRSVGRDPPRGVVVPRYRPPEGESPASMRYLELMGYDNRCFVAGILSLAVKGYLVIEQQAGGLLRKGKYALQRKAGSSTPLTPDEEALLRSTFAGRDSLLLDDQYHTTLQGAKKAQEQELQRKYRESFFHINFGWHFLGLVLSVLAISVVIFALSNDGRFGIEWFVVTPGGWATVAVAFVALVVNGPFAKLLKAPTRVGRQRMDEIEGFKLYLEVAEGDELKLAGAPRKTPGLFEAYLPFALALGVSQRWSEKFADVFRTQAASGYAPAWYSGDRWDSDNLSGFSSSLARSFDSAIASASTPPGESSGSSGGGGSSAGGSSGGGGGGGGGGGW
jgi:uncharacterized membrane protein YgcG